MSDEILVRSVDRGTEITLNRPDAGNGVTNEMAATLGRAIEAAGDSHFIVLRGAGKDFCTGRAVMGARPADRPPAYERRGAERGDLRVLRRLSSFPGSGWSVWCRGAPSVSAVHWRHFATLPWPARRQPFNCRKWATT